MNRRLRSCSARLMTPQGFPFPRMRRIRLVIALIAMVASLFLFNDIARSGSHQPWIDFDLGRGLQSLGRIILLNQDNEDQLRTAAREKKVAGPSEIDHAIVQIFDLQGSRPNPINVVSLQPTNLPTASGSGQNLSRDGACAVGYQDNGFFTPFHAVRWTQATGPVDLGTLDPTNNASRSSTATDTNQDCSVVVGLSDVTGGATEHAFRWTSGGMVDLGAPANGGPNSRALGVSSAGTVIVGDADFPDPGNLVSGKSLQAFRWTQAGGFQNLNDSPQPTLSLATAVTGDGTVIVGQVRSSNNASSAVRWTIPPPPAQLVMQPIGPLPGHATAAATGVSDNGKIVVGISNPDFLQYRGPGLGWNVGIAFRWTQAKGIQDLRQVLIDSGADLTGITLVSVTGISPDGQWIQGAATTPQTGQNGTAAFIAQVCDDAIGGTCSSAGAAPFTIGAANPNLTVAAGQSATTTITVTPDAGFAQPVSFACSGLPQGAACSFNPASVTPAGGPVNTTLTISTDGGAVALLAPDGVATMLAYMLAPFALFATVVFVGGKRFNPSKRDLWTGVLLFLIVVTTASCNGDSSSPPPVTSGGGAPATGTPAGTSAVTVTATSGAGNSGVPVTLTVTR